MKKVDLTGRNDLTRWNRAGLKQFRYIDGNAPIYLETLRKALQHNFTDGDQLQWTALQDLLPEQANETVAKANQRLLGQYYSARRDYAWEIIRTFSRSTHILTEYIDAYANESYLDTAVEWENVRRLVALLGYQPAPPSSAETWLALLIKKDLQGIIKKGYAVKNKPQSGDSPIVFETLNDYQGSAKINELRLNDWNQSQKKITIESSEVSYELEEPVDSISVGNKGILVYVMETNEKAVCVEVKDIDGSKLTLGLVGDDQPMQIDQATVKLFISHNFAVSPLPYASKTLVLENGHGLSEGMVVAVRSSNATYVVSKVSEVTGDRIVLEKGIFGVELVILQKSNAQYTAKNELITFLPGNSKPRVWSSNFEVITSVKCDTTIPGYHLMGSDYPSVYFMLKQSQTINIVDSNPTKLLFTGKAGKIKSGDWVFLQFDSDNTSKHRAVKIESIIQNESNYEVCLDPSESNKIKLLLGNFEHIVRHKDYEKNKEVAWNNNKSTVQSTALELATLPKALGRGKQLIIKGKDNCKSVSIVSVDKDTNTIHVIPPFHNDVEESDFETWSTRVYGNVVKAGHGETQVEKILGSGNNAEINQEYILDAEDVSFVSDAAFPRGVRADLIVRVEGRMWEQVPHLRFSEAEDHHYQVNIAENGTISLRFGNGTNGRRLPTGVDNLRIKYRVGTGLAGNIIAGSLVKNVHPHDRIDGFVHCLATAGGNDRESADSMRENAPASLLTLERAVSVTDFTHLVSQHSSVYQAHALEQIPDIAGTPIIKIVIVPAGGGALTLQQKNLLTSYINKHAVPDIDFRLVGYQRIKVSLAIRIEVDSSAWEPEAIRHNTMEYLLEKLQLQERNLGEALFHSTVVNLVEQVEGVENCFCSMTLPEPIDPSLRIFNSDDGQIKRISVSHEQLIIIDRSLVSVESKEYSL